MIGVLALVLFLLLILIGGDRGAVAVLALCGNIAVLAFTVILLANGAPPFLVIFAATLSIVVGCFDYVCFIHLYLSGCMENRKRWTKRDSNDTGRCSALLYDGY